MNIEATAVVSKNAIIEPFCNIGSFVVVGPNVFIGEHTKVEPFTLIEKDVVIGERCEIESHSALREGLTLRNRVRWGSGAKNIGEVKVCDGASIGANALLIGDGLIIGQDAIVEPGATVTYNVEPGSTFSVQQAMVAE